MPVIAIFTKFDALYTVAFSELVEQGMRSEEALAMVPQQAEQMFKDKDFHGILQSTKFPPKNFVCMGGELIICNDIE